MAILTQFPTTQWQITLNRVETESEASLAISHITVTGNTVVSITGSGLQRVLTLGTAVSMLSATSITITAHTSMEVVSVANYELINYLNQIRTLIWTNLTSEDLPDSTISEDVYLGLAESETLGSLSLTTSQYDTKAASDSTFATRSRVSVMYRAAAYLLPAVPQLLREEINSEYQQFAQVDWQERQTFFLKVAGDSIENDVPDDSGTTGGFDGKRYIKRTYF